MTTPQALTNAVLKLKNVLQDVLSGSDGELESIAKAKSEVVARFQPTFAPVNIPQLSIDTFHEFLLFKNNKHWSGLQRQAARICADPISLRKALYILVDESRPIDQRLNELLPSGGSPLVPGLGKAVLTAILQVEYPDKYGVWNGASQAAMQQIQILPSIKSSDPSGDCYVRINATLLALCKELNIDLWTLDDLWWRVKLEEVGDLELSYLLQSVMDGLSLRENTNEEGTPEPTRSRLKELVEVQGRSVVAKIVGNSFSVKGRTGIGTDADVPWIGIFAGDDSSAQEGCYLVYLFAADGSAVYLSLNQGTEKLRSGRTALIKRAMDIRTIIGPESDLIRDIDLRSSIARPTRYQAGSAYAILYESNEIPPNDQLKADLNMMLDRYRKLQASGFKPNSTYEATHFLFKWSSDFEPATIETHREIAEVKGSVWWGKFDKTGSYRMNGRALRLIEEQLKNSIPTHVILYRRGEIWQTHLEQITVTKDEVDEARLPSYYKKEDCSLFVRISHFQHMPDDWAARTLIMANDPQSDLGGALGNSTNPLFIYERFLPSAIAQTGDTQFNDKAELSLEWLQEHTLWRGEDLAEVLECLKGPRPQIILAGPPGTGKTWVAEYLARFLTQDNALAYRVVQLHPSYGYENLMEGLRPEIDDHGRVNFKRIDGVVLSMVEKIPPGGASHVLIIDEMNRANLPKVFGELMYLFEYRDKAIDLLYTKDFELPPGLAFIGTMNTADRSIRSIDVALRRRFEVFECPPDRRILEAYYLKHKNEVPDLVAGFEKLNSELVDKLDRHHTIGHTFFMHPVMNIARLKRTWKRQIWPLIEEYFFDQPDLAAEFRVERFWPEANSAG